MKPDASLGVLIPTRNSAALLPDHLRSLAGWVDLAEEVVVVDSFSTDGTENLLRQGLSHPRIQFLSHPPGLYASWNVGLQRLTTRYAYISTIGDTISRAGMHELLDTAEQFQADVVISKPAFQKPNRATAQVHWPIDDIVQTLKITTPRLLHRLEAITFAGVHATTALTGSCASDLFRTDVLQRNPFPTDFGTVGDGIWGIRQAAQVSWAVLPHCFSTFLLHSTSVSQAENKARPGMPRADAVLREATRAWRRAGLVTDAELDRIRWSQLTETLTQYLDAKAAFDSCRCARWPWTLNPFAWRSRVQRERSLHQLRARMEFALQSAGVSSCAGSAERHGSRVQEGCRKL